MSHFGVNQTGFPTTAHPALLVLTLLTSLPSHTLLTLPPLVDSIAILQDPLQIAPSPQSHSWLPRLVWPLLPTVLSLDLPFLDSTCVEALGGLALPPFLDHKLFGTEALLLYPRHHRPPPPRPQLASSTVDVRQIFVK